MWQQQGGTQAPVSAMLPRRPFTIVRRAAPTGKLGVEKQLARVGDGGLPESSVLVRTHGRFSATECEIVRSLANEFRTRRIANTAAFSRLSASSGPALIRTRSQVRILSGP